jgi:hypothetical protein
MIVSVFVRRLKPGATFQDFVREWEADKGFGVPTRVFNAQSLTDPPDHLDRLRCRDTEAGGAVAVHSPGIRGGPA